MSLTAPQIIKAYPGVDVHSTPVIQADTYVAGYLQVFVDIVMKTITGGTSPTFTFSVYRKDGQATPNQLLLSTASSVNAVSAVVTFGVGPGLAVNSVPGSLMAVGWTVTGTPTTATADITFWGIPAAAY